MCGIVGIIHASNVTGKTRNVAFLRNSEELIKDAVIASGVRGLDSTGVFQTDKTLTSYYHRLPVAGHMFLEDRTTKSFLADVGSSLFSVFHLRAATHGRVSLNNTHPFLCKTKDKYILGVHNGTLTGWSTKKDASRYSVDSEWALNHIAANGLPAFEDFEGSFSFVWTDSLDPTKLLFARNKERPMVFARTKDKRHMLFGSEAGMLSWLADRRDISIEDEMYESEPGYLYSVDAGQSELKWERVEELPTKKVVATTTHTAHRQSRDARDDDWDYSDDYGWSFRGHGSPMSSYGNYYKDNGEKEKNRLISDIKSLLADVPQDESTEDVPAVDVELATEVDEITEQTDGSTIADIALGMPMVAERSWFDDSTVTNRERKKAQKLKFYGEVVQFRAEDYDASTKTTVGWIVEDFGTKESVEYAAVLRGLKEEEFNKWKGCTNYGVIGGIPLNTGEVAEDFIVVPLTELGEDKVLEHLL